MCGSVSRHVGEGVSCQPDVHMFACVCVLPFQPAYWARYGEEDAWCPGALPDPEIVRMVEARKSLGEVSVLEVALEVDCNVPLFLRV